MSTFGIVFVGDTTADVHAYARCSIALYPNTWVYPWPARVVIPRIVELPGDEAGLRPGGEAGVDVHDGECSAGLEQSRESGLTLAAVAVAGRDGQADDRYVDETGDDRRERTFAARRDDEHILVPEAVDRIYRPGKARNPDIVDTGHGGTHLLGVSAASPAGTASDVPAVTNPRRVQRRALERGGRRDQPVRAVVPANCRIGGGFVQPLPDGRCSGRIESCHDSPVRRLNS